MIPAWNESQAAYCFTAIVLLVSITAFYYRPLFHAFAFYPFAVFKGRQLHTLITSSLVHVHWAHLLVNGLFLFVFLSEAEYMLVDDFGSGHGLLWLFVLVTGIAVFSCLLSGFFNRHQVMHTSAGCSALIFGLVMFFFFYLPLDQAPFDDSLLPVVYSYQMGLAFFMGLTLLVLFKVGRAAPIHWYGALAGFCLALIIGPGYWVEWYHQVRG